MGSVTIRGEAVQNTRDIFVGTFSGKNLVNKDGCCFGCFGKSDPFIKIFRQVEDGSFINVWTNIRIDNNLNPVWPVARIPMSKLCYNDIMCPLKFEVWDHQSNGYNCL